MFILYPHGRVSEVQRRQMTGVDAPNVHVIALEGTFDDCQAVVKALFNHARFRDELQLSGVNSINWARIAAQTVYYFTAAVALGGPHRPISFAVPTGNFGDILAAWVAKRMGLPVERLMLATNANDILARTLATGTYELRGVVPTTSPSMDIQISSNFERLLFEAYGRDAAAVRRLMASLAQSRAFTIAPEALARIRRDFAAEAGRRGSRARGDQGYVGRGRLPARSSHRGRRQGRARAARARAGHARGGAGDGASGQVPGRGRAGDGRAALAPGASRRPP